MSADPSLERTEATSATANARYEVLELMGSGGMAAVHRVRDRSSGEEIALKRLQAPRSGSSHAKVQALFEREYYTLSQLAHPRVVQVHDYGVDEQGPYYTMELLDGGDLHALVPVPWQRACALARDVCSVLSLLHSRGSLHRDISPRNIRCTADGLAKLIDFGAMAPMGPCKQVVGTPPMCAPEVLEMGALDARTDLYALGATLYFALAGRHAYPARDFRTLRQAWSGEPPPPGHWQQGIPQELDALVLSLLSQDADARPASAAEVMQRLSAIAGLPSDEHQLVSHAYLKSPTLVGRGKMLARVRKKLERARNGRGGGLLVVGPSGVGRSRFLDACLLEGKLAGSTVVRVDAADSEEGEYGAVRALAGRLLQALPEPTRQTARAELPVLGHVIPELLEGQEPVELVCFDDPQQRRPLLQQALRRWLLGLSRQHDLVIGVDDVDRVDEPSAAFAALLANAAGEHPLALVAAAQDHALEASFGPIRLLADASTHLPLSTLGRDDIEALLRSVFGDVPNVQVLTHALDSIAGGNPRDVMQLAQHLLDRGIIGYESGAWSLPASIDGGDLPSDLAQALALRAAALGLDARELARAMALAPNRSLGVERLLLLTGHRDRQRLAAALDELLAAAVIRGTGTRFELAQAGWIVPLLEDLGELEGARLHARLSELFSLENEPFRAAQHLLRAGEVDAGLDTLIEHARASTAETDEDPDAYARLLASLPGDWLQTYRQGLQLCSERKRPLKDLFALLNRMSSLIPGGQDAESARGLLEILRVATGIDLHQGLDPAMEPMERLGKSFELAQARYDQMPEADRIYAPVEALRPLARACVQAIGVTASRLDLDLWDEIPSLAPFEPLSPALGVVHQLVQGNGHRLKAQMLEAIRVYERLLERAEQPDRAGLDETYHHAIVFGVGCGLGLIEACMGRDKALRWASAIEGDPAHQVNAVLIRMLYHLWQGDAAAAAQCKGQVEVLRIQNSPRQWFEGSHLMGELTAYAASDDLVRTRQALAGVAIMAADMPSWAPILHYGQGEYHRIRGAYSAALQELEAAVALTSAGRHQLWGELVGAQVRVLDQLGQHAQAVELGDRSLEAGIERGLDYTLNFIRMPLAVACAHHEQRERADELASAALQDLSELDAGALLVGNAHETCALVALQFGEQSAFEQHARQCGALFKAASNHALTAKYQRLMDAARRSRVSISSGLADAAARTADTGRCRLVTVLQGVDRPEQRAARALELMLREGDAVGGALYAITPQGPRCAAQQALPDTVEGLAELAREHLLSELSGSEPATATGTLMTSMAGGTAAGLELPGLEDRVLRSVLVAHSAEGDLQITGVAFFVVERGAPFMPPVELATQLSRYWHEEGDASCLTSGAAWTRTYT